MAKRKKQSKTQKKKATTARGKARKASKAAKRTVAKAQSGINNKSLPIVDLSASPIRPEHTLDIWLNVDNGKLL
jgi:hypothetical protein